MYSVDDLLNSNFEEGDGEILSDNERGHEIKSDDENAESKAEDKKVVTPKKPRAKSNIPRLNIDRLKGPRGLVCMERWFSTLEYKGHGHEERDLKMLMKKLHQWTHRLFPKYTLDDTLLQLERLGTKKPILTLKKKIVMDLYEEETPIINEETNNEQSNVDEFDLLLSQPVNTVPPVAVVREIDDLTEEQKEAIARNRLLAAERRRARLEAQRQHSTTQLDTNGVSESHDEIETIVLSQEKRDVDAEVFEKMQSMDASNENSMAQVIKDVEMAEEIVNTHLTKTLETDKNIADAQEMSIDDILDQIDTPTE